jgi:ubiquinone/menaquinone biosynthesis C-methylase UbiE
MGRTPDCPVGGVLLASFAAQRPLAADTKGNAMTTHTLNVSEREAMLEIVEAIAPTWERRRAEIEQVATPVREWMLRELRPQEGDTVLELAARVGDTGFEAAQIIGDSGRLITSDFSPAMLDAASRRGSELGLRNVDYRLIDAERIELGDDSVDGVLCRFGYILLPDPAAAFAETRRVLRPGGRVALAVWGAMERNPLFAIAGISLYQRGPHPAARAAAGAGAVQHGEPRARRGLAARRRLRPGAH